MPAKLTKRLIETLQPRDEPFELRDSELKGFVVRIERGGAKTFYLRYAFGGKRSCRHKLGVFPNVSVEGARSLAKAASGDVAKGIDPAARKKEEKIKAANERVSTLGVYLKEKFEPHALTHMKSGAVQLKRIRSDFEKLLNKPLMAIDKDMVAHLQQDWLKAGLQKRTINRDLQRISSVLSHAVSSGTIKHHPLKGGAVAPLKYDKKKVPRFLKPDEEAALRSALIAREEKMRADRDSFNDNKTISKKRKVLPKLEGDYIDHLRPMVLLAMNCGLRRGELFSLRWTDVSLTTKMITVEGDANEEGDGSKSGHSRPIPLNTEALSVLKAWKKRQADTNGLVFPSQDGARFNNVNKSWSAVRKAAGLNKFNFHHLRHSFASKLVQAGVPLNTVRELMGHADISTTTIYAHLAPGNLHAAVALLNSAAA
jgi:integrase